MEVEARVDAAAVAAGHDHVAVGHAGGDPVRHCENTLEATRSALERGANAVEIDVSMSKDGVLFLWHDPNPLHVLALTRRLALISKTLNHFRT